MFNFFPTKAEEVAAAAGSSSGQTAGSSSGQTVVVDEANKWPIRITLRVSDVDTTKRKLRLPKGGPGGVEDNILRYLRPEIVLNVLAGKQEKIKMIDVDERHIVPDMTISKDLKVNHFYIKGHWFTRFVQPRSLQADDEIGLRWNTEEHCLEFSKLPREY